MGSYRNGGHGGDQSGTCNGNAGGTLVDKGIDFAKYFCTYAFLYHQKEMLSDRVCMDAYYNAVFRNKHHFHGKAGKNENLLKKLHFKLGEEKGKRHKEIWVTDLVTRSIFRTEASSLITKSPIQEAQNNHHEQSCTYQTYMEPLFRPVPFRPIPSHSVPSCPVYVPNGT